MKRIFTPCNQCVHFIDRPWGWPKAWFSYHCKAVPKPQEKDIITGKMLPVEYPFCRDINKGMCDFFLER